MRKEFEINGCIEVQAEITEDEFFDAFINEIQDVYYILPDGTKEKSVLEDE